MIRACLFDIGNVLVTFDYARTLTAIAARSARSYHEIHAHLAAVSGDLETGRLSSADFISRGVDFIGGGIRRTEFEEAFTGIFEPIDAVWQAVADVTAKVPAWLFSNTSELHETCLFRRYPGFAKFHGGFYSWRLGTMKPDPGMYEHALAALGLPAEEIACIDDLPANIETGRRFGFHCHQYDRARHADLVRFLTDCGLMDTCRGG